LSSGREHSLAKRREHGARSLASKKVAAQLPLQKLDRARQRWLGNVALLGRAGEIQRARDGQEVSDLVHFHANVTPGRSPKQKILARLRTKVGSRQPTHILQTRIQAGDEAAATLEGNVAPRPIEGDHKPVAEANRKSPDAPTNGINHLVQIQFERLAPGRDARIVD